MNNTAVRIKSLRARLSLTQEALAAALGVSFATVNRWENAGRKPSALALKKLAELENGNPDVEQPRPALQIDFSGKPQAVKALVEARRLAFAHTINPVFATEVSRIDPLPHQRIAVYERMLPQQRLRFLLADDAGAGKTIMAGLAIREMIERQKIRRILIVPPAGLVGNWQSELKGLFQLDAKIASGKDMGTANPFADDHNILIVSIDTLRGEKARNLLKSPATIPYDLVIFDEAHKLSCTQGFNAKIDKSDRYKLAEMLAGADDGSADEWHLAWHPEHLLLLTATPHMGKEYPYFALWRLLEPQYFTTLQGFANIARAEKEKYFIRRTKEEMVHIDGRPLYPTRISDTLGFSLSQGPNSEQQLYDETTDYLINIYNKAVILNPSAAKLAMSVFQRRLSSSTYALKCSFERRLNKIDELVQQILEGRIGEKNLARGKRLADIFENKTADEENGDDSGQEENERFENEAIEQVIYASLADLKSEQERVRMLLDLAARVLKEGREAKFESLLEITRDRRFQNEKILIFTEHKDTLEYLIQKLGAYGYASQIAAIHGGMDWQQRQEAIEQFRKPLSENGAKYLICTDAAAEGVNLQFCWIMINYDIPWNPARLEQRMGRIHRYGQKHDPVFLLNLVATSTREGKVLETLLAKLEKIRKELSSDKVFDSIGRVFSDVSIKRYMERALLAARAHNLAALTAELEGEITQEQVSAAYAKEARIFGDGGDVAACLPAMRENLFCEDYRRLLPGFVEGFMRMALPLLDVRLVESEARGCYKLDASKSAHAADLYAALNAADKNLVTFSRAHNANALWAHPGEPFFAAVAKSLQACHGNAGLAGGIFIDSGAEQSCLIHVALYSILHENRPVWNLVAVRQKGANIEFCPLEEFLCIQGRTNEAIPADGQRMASAIADNVEKAKAFLLEHARKMAEEESASLKAQLPARQEGIRKGFAYQNMELASRRSMLNKKKRQGLDIGDELELVKSHMRGLDAQKEAANKKLIAEIGQIRPGEVRFVAHALVLPDIGARDAWQIDNVEEMAMQVTRAYEEEFGKVWPVHTPELAQKQGLQARPGFDVLSLRKGENGKIIRRCIEVKGTRGEEFVSMTENEWSRAMTLGDEYWLYVVANCATPRPRLLRIQNPVLNLCIRPALSSQISRRLKISELAAMAEAD